MRIFRRWFGVLWGGLALGAARPAAAQPQTKVALPDLPTVPAAVDADSAAAAKVVHTTPRGVRYVFHERGTGEQAQVGNRVAIRYTGFLPDGHAFDATAAWGGPLRFRVGRGQVIAGWDELVPLLPAGSRVRAWVPAALAYGAKGYRHPNDPSRYLIPPDTELVFELYVVSVH